MNRIGQWEQKEDGVYVAERRQHMQRHEGLKPHGILGNHA